MRHRQKIAIARLISDLIKADDVICRQEIAAYNKIVRTFDISPDELHEAQQITLADSLAIVKHMSCDEQKKLLATLSDAAYSDNTCVSHEALLLLTLSLVISGDSEKYTIFSQDMKGYPLTDKYVIYLESDYMPAINEEIAEQYDTIANLLQLWNFEFIYIPRLSQAFRDMDMNYLFDILRYMNPRLSEDMLEALYQRLTTFTTENYTRDYLATTCQQDFFYNIEPTLLVNVGTSLLPSVSSSQKERCVMNMLAIRLDDEPNCVLQEVRRLVDEYENLITEPEYHRPKRGKGLFRYHGFYKQLFDFLARHGNNGADNSILVDLRTHRIWMRGVEIPMSATHLATYVFILHQSFCTHYGGLLKAGQHHPLSEKDIMRLGRTYHAIGKLLREGPMTSEQSYLENVPNIRGYIARIRTMIEHSIDSQDIDYYFPKDSADKSMYHIAINPACVRVRDATGEYPFMDYPYWKQLKG